MRSPTHVEELRGHLERLGSQAKIIAKIEQAEALDHLEDIIAASDAVMVARGDLGVELGVEMVPIAQKRIIACARAQRKPVITATQMLDSMISRPEATRAEASDIANAIIDGTSALMLSAETASGRFPVESVAMMSRVARATEIAFPRIAALPSTIERHYSISEAVADAACTLAADINAPAIIVPTITGSTVSAVESQRPQQPVLAVSPVKETLRSLALSWGVIPLLAPARNTIEELREDAVIAARESGYAQAGDRVVLISGQLPNAPGSTNMVTVETIPTES